MTESDAEINRNIALTLVMIIVRISLHQITKK